MSIVLTFTNEADTKLSAPTRLKNPSRRHEFLCGRTAANSCLSKLGLSSDVGIEPLPQWPAGVIGSISHSKGFAAATAAFRSQELSRLGLDIERSERKLSSKAVKRYCTESELSFYSPEEIFIAKEACIKACFPERYYLSDVKVSRGYAILSTQRLSLSFAKTSGFNLCLAHGGSASLHLQNLVDVHTKSCVEA